MRVITKLCCALSWPLQHAYAYESCQLRNVLRWHCNTTADSGHQRVCTACSGSPFGKIGLCVNIGTPSIVFVHCCSMPCQWIEIGCDSWLMTFTMIRSLTFAYNVGKVLLLETITCGKAALHQTCSEVSSLGVQGKHRPWRTQGSCWHTLSCRISWQSPCQAHTRTHSALFAHFSNPCKFTQRCASAVRCTKLAVFRANRS